MLRARGPVGYTELYESVEKLSDAPVAQETIDEAIEELLNLGWLTGFESDGEMYYEIHVQKKEGSDVSRARRAGDAEDPGASAKMSELWDAVESGSEAAEDGTPAQREMTDFHRQRAKFEDEEEDKGRKGGLFGLFRKKG